MNSYKLEFYKYKLKRKLESYPKLYMMVARNYANLVGDKSGRVISKNSKVCIEGFPRCANSFAWHAFTKYTGIAEGIATHIHSAAQIKQAINYRIPTIVTIRDPKNCITSLRALGVQYQGDYDKPLVFPLELDLKWYISFYKSLVPLKHYFVVADFAETINDFGALINRLNEMHENRFPIVASVNKKEISGDILEEKKGQEHLGPNKKRDLIKDRFVKEYENSSLLELKEEAESVYKLFIS